MKAADELVAFAKKHTSAVVLTLLATAASTYVLVVDAGSVTTNESLRRKEFLFVAWRGSDVTRVEVEEGELHFALELEPGGKRTWKLVAPGGTFPADELIVDRLLSTFEYAKFVREVPPDSVDRASFGLDEPRARYTISMGAIRHKLTFGKNPAPGNAAYAEVEGRGVFVVDASLVAALAVAPTDMRSKSFVPYLSTDLVELDLEGTGGTRRFERAPWSGGRGSGFRFAAGSEGPVGMRADGSRLDQVLVSFGRMQAEVFLEDAAARAASKPLVTITMVPREGPRGVLDIGGECPEKKGFVVAVRREPSFLGACVPEGVLPPLLRPAADFEDDGILGATVDEIIELRIARGDEVLDMARFGEGFKVRRPTERQIPADIGNELLKDIVAARGAPAPADAKFQDGAVPIVVRARSQGGASQGGVVPDRVEEVEVGPYDAGRVLAIRKEDGQKLLLGDAAAYALRPSDLLLRDLDLVDATSLDIEELVIEHLGKAQHLSRSGATFALLEPKGEGLQADDGFANQAVSAIVSLHAIRWVSEKEEPGFGLAEPRYTVKVTLGDSGAGTGEKTHLTLKIGALADDGAYATLSSDAAPPQLPPGAPPPPSLAGVFVLDTRIEDVLERNFVARNLFDIDTANADKIEVKRGDKVLTLVRDGRQLRLEGGSSFKAAALEKALGDIAPMTAVSVGAASAEQGFEEPALIVTVMPRKSPTDSDAPPAVRLLFGAADNVDDVVVRYGRRDGVDATFAIPQSSFKRLLEAFGR
ncbi:MAG: DUF4340 domain-containing protein [Polyangiaceae bacterium]